MSPSLLETNDYPIYFGEQGIRALNESLRSGDYSSVFVLVDENTEQACLPIFLHFADAVEHASTIRIASGEEHKDIDTCRSIWHELLTRGADRHSLLINLGGGVITDMGGFAAATFKRGIDFIHVPTTLLALVDASVGGKVGIDFEGAKNQVGVFAQPGAVLIFPKFLKSLSKQHYLAGFAEVIKHGLIADADYWRRCTETSLADTDDLQGLIYESIRIKYEFVKRDPFDRGNRHALNFGHTVGHALESHFLIDDERMPLLHGEAVAAGMVIESYLSYRMAGLPHDQLDEISGFILDLFGSAPLRADEGVAVLEWMRKDKKNVSDEIRFCLIPKIGEFKVGEACSDELIHEGLNYYLQRAELQPKKH